MAQAALKRATQEEILRLSIPLFAARGYDAVSLREIAAAVGIQAPALYYHFSDKQSLYLAAVDYAFSARLTLPIGILSGGGSPLARLQDFIVALVEELASDEDLLLLLQRERLKVDPARHKLLVDQVLAPALTALMQTIEQLDPDQDPMMLALTVSGMAMFHLETRSSALLIPGLKPHHVEPAEIAQHLCELIETLFTIR